MKLITLSGIDGSGKSTQLKLIEDFLASQNKKVFTLHFVEFSIANKLLGSGKDKTSEAPKAKTKSGWLGIQFRKLALCMDSSRFNRLVKKLKKEGHDYLLCDRYFYDSLVNIQYLSKKRLPACCEKGIPKPDVAIYLKVSPEKAMSRERIPEQGVEYLLEKSKLFKENIARWNLITLDAEQEKEVIFEGIKKLLT